MRQISDAISVVIPTYNRAHLIKESLQSVLAQTLQPYEIIVVDDFSTDHTEDVVNSLNSPLIKYVKNNRKKGANGARNTGILMAQGEYIAFHDSDDLWMPTKLEKQYDLMKRDRNIDLCFCSLETKNKFGGTRYIPNKKIKSTDISALIKKSSFISTQTIFVKSDKAQKILFDEDIYRLQDWEFLLRFQGNIIHLNQSLVVQKINNSSITKTVKVLPSYELIFNKFPEISNLGVVNKLMATKLMIEKDDGIFLRLKLVVYTVLRVFIYIKNII